MPAVIQVAGVVMVASGGLMAAVQHDLGRLFGYAALSDLGVLLLALAMGGSQSVTLTLLHGIGRSISIALMAAGLAILRHRAGMDRFADLHGVARRLPLATAGFVLGGLALAGFPLTAGFPTHWAVTRALAAGTAGDPAAGSLPGLWALLLVASSVGILVGLGRALNAMLGAEPREEVARHPVLASLIVLALAALTIVLGLYPQLLLGSVQQAAQAFSLF
jgi:formate hydrogenlyase subunit 3/multisubunit Na+/H+ antiporter MnhD subunit